MTISGIDQGNMNTYTEVKANKASPSIKEVMNNLEINSGYVPTVQEKTLIRTIEDANRKLNGADKEFEFSIHEKTKQIMVKVLDKSTKEVVREIPSEKILDMVAAMCEGAGLFVDEKL